MLGFKKDMLTGNSIPQLYLIVFLFLAGICIQQSVEICRHLDGEVHIHSQPQQCDRLHATNAIHHHPCKRESHDHGKKPHHAPCSHEIVEQESNLFLAESKIKLSLPLCSYFKGSKIGSVLGIHNTHAKTLAAVRSHDPPLSLSAQKHFSETIRLVV